MCVVCVHRGRWEGAKRAPSRRGKGGLAGCQGCTTGGNATTRAGRRVGPPAWKAAQAAAAHPADARKILGEDHLMHAGVAGGQGAGGHHRQAGPSQPWGARRAMGYARAAASARLAHPRQARAAGHCASSLTVPMMPADARRGRRGIASGSARHAAEPTVHAIRPCTAQALPRHRPGTCSRPPPTHHHSQLSHLVFCRCISSWMAQRVEATLWAKQQETCSTGASRGRHGE